MADDGVKREKIIFTIDAPIANKRDICVRISKYTGFKYEICSMFYDAFIDAIKNLIFEGFHISMKGFMNIRLRETRRREGLLYGKKIMIRPMRKLAIRISPEIKKRLEAIIIDDGVDVDG